MRPATGPELAIHFQQATPVAAQEPSAGNGGAPKLVGRQDSLASGALQYDHGNVARGLFLIPGVGRPGA